MKNSDSDIKNFTHEILKTAINMEPFKGPLGSHSNYIHHIALQNCIDYFRLAEGDKEKGLDDISDKYKRLRYFLNAIESINNIPSYFFHEYKKGYSWQDENTILKRMREKHTILGDVNEITNAYKHCITKKSDKCDAKDLQEPKIKIHVSMSSGKTDVEYDFDSIESTKEKEKILSKAFGFWIDYINNQDKEFLVP
uniref:Uncharacterized protein n=1 Tax=Candidatus Kentrum sp. TUN TaxID=2126343 RepID=A0A450ZUP4_9GAMM|nr:MAG: hypothetical protein BECKTUN1418E_GA0071001_100535 [Candidatus Kentron sp. TUN]VFK57468.1 MAG: hypothetical protein BECKTUN1418F_GA0071002_11171 [Candidatus Kentron sp. TUN]